ncbi:hypothetical protein [Actinomycetospora sp. NBC_00405]|uniref:hypothetical protein n=1 Tax=Actinomycetospora sp. NBC_00405 TaxID=2975952 RepID=UPI002E1DC456
MALAEVGRAAGVSRQAVAFQSGQHAGLLADLDAGTRARALHLLHDDLVAHHVPHRGVYYRSAAWIVRARNGLS